MENNHFPPWNNIQLCVLMQKPVRNQIESIWFSPHFAVFPYSSLHFIQSFSSITSIRYSPTTIEWPEILSFYYITEKFRLFYQLSVYKALFYQVYELLRGISYSKTKRNQRVTIETAMSNFRSPYVSSMYNTLHHCIWYVFLNVTGFNFLKKFAVYFFVVELPSMQSFIFEGTHIWGDST